MPDEAPQERDKVAALAAITDRVMTHAPPRRPTRAREREAWDNGVIDGREVIRLYASEALTAIAAALDANDPDWALELTELFIILFGPDEEKRKLRAGT